VTSREFRAFISYSHADELWAKWLHGALERYRVPRPLVGRVTPRGVVPRRLLPIFRDRDELPGSPSLADEIADSLARSKSLIVICSPKAAASKYVGSEIVNFKRRGLESHILCLLVDGEPHATDKPESGALEALPAAIRYRVNGAGQITDERDEPLAADVRPGKDSRADAKLKIIAGMLGVGFDELKRRESRRQFLRRLQASVASLVILATVAGIWWNRQQALEGQQRITASQKLAAQSAEYAKQRPDLSSLLALAALDVSDTAEARDAVFAAAAQINQPIATIRDIASGKPATVKFSADGKTLAVGTASGNVTLWDVAYARKLGGNKGHADTVTALAFSPDHQTLASGSLDGTVVLWDTRSFTKRKELKPAAGRVLDVAFARDGTTLRTASERGVVLWRVGDGARIAGVPSAIPSNNTVGLNQDGTRVGVSGDWLLVWHADTDKLLATMKPPAGRFITRFAFSRDGRTVMTVDSEGAVVTWEADTGRKIREVGPAPGTASDVQQIAIAADASVVARYGGAITISDLTRNTSAAFPIARDERAECLAVTEDGQRIAWCGEHGAVSILDRNARPFRTAFSAPDLKGVHGLGFSPDGALLASGGAGGTVILWNLDGREKALLRGKGLTISSVAFGANDTIAAGVRHGAVTVWRTSTPDTPTSLSDAGGIIGSQIAFSSDGTTLASATYETITLWDTKSWQSTGTLKNPATARRIAFHPKEALLACANSDGTLTLWDTAAQKRVATLQAHQGEVMGLAFSSDGKKLASAGRDGTVIVWDAQTRTPLSRFDALDEIFSIAFSPDGKLLAHGGDNGRVVLRDVQDFRQRVAIREHRATVSALVFSPDGRSLASTDGDSLIVWNDLDPAAWKRRACLNAGRDLTEDEWKMFRGEGARRTLCSD